MHRILLALSIFSVIGLSSCKKTVSKKACFTFSKSSIKLGDTVYLFNCSEGYNRLMWFFPNGATDTNRHSYYIPVATGDQQIHLRIGDNLFTDTVGAGKTLTVTP